MTETISLVLIGLMILIIVGGYLLYRRVGKSSAQDLESELNKIFPKVLQNANSQLISMADEKLGAEKKEIRTDVDNKKQAIEKLVKQVLDELSESNKKLELAEKERIGSFRELKKEVENHKTITEQLSVTTEGLQKILSNNQLRGQFGEQVAEDLLRMSGFVKGTDYEFNKKQADSETRPDFSVFLPDGTRINVDSKFPYNNLQRYIETEDKETKVKLLKAFSRDIKEKIKQVSTRDYINPADKTVDFVILFIPNEMIFSFIYDTLGDVWVDAMQKKVILAGPFSFTAILRMVRQAHSNFSYQQNVHSIIEHIKTFEKEFEKYNESFQKIGDRIESLSKQYHDVEGTRYRQLIRTVDKIKLEDSSQQTELKSITTSD